MKKHIMNSFTVYDNVNKKNVLIITEDTPEQFKKEYGDYVNLLRNSYTKEELKNFGDAIINECNIMRKAGKSEEEIKNYAYCCSMKLINDAEVKRN